jgi:hypothetical protein
MPLGDAGNSAGIAREWLPGAAAPGPESEPRGRGSGVG